MSGGATGDRRGTAAGSKGVGSGTATESLGDHEGSQLRERESSAAAAAAAAAAAVDRRLTRSRARELGLGMQNTSWPEIGGRKLKKRRLAAKEGPKELESHTEEKNLVEQEQQREVTQMSVPARGVRELESLSEEKNLEEQEQQREGTEMSVPARGVGELESHPEEKNLGEQEQQRKGTQMSVPARGVRMSRGHCRDRGSMISKRDARLLDGAPWLVHVSTTDLDGKEIFRGSGTVIHWDKEKAWILTSFHVVFCQSEARLYSPMPKLAVYVEKAVHLPNKGKYDGEMLFFSERYQFALIEVKSTVEVKPPHDGSRPWYNDKVKALARDEKMSLKLHNGTIMWEEENCFLFVDCKFLPCGTGGPVINHAGEIVGMSCYYDEGLAIISITTIRICIKMWTEFGCIAHPMLGMSFRTVKLLDIVRQDRLSYKYNISDGFIVEKVTVHSDAEKHGIRRGNVISFFNVDPRYLPEFEDHLLNIGSDLLNGTSKVNDFKLEVNDLVGKVKRTIILPLQISNGSED